LLLPGCAAQLVARQERRLLSPTIEAAQFYDAGWSSGRSRSGSVSAATILEALRPGRTGDGAATSSY
jgi:hypothetical protein